MTAGYLVVDLGAVVFHFDHARRLALFAQACGLSAAQIHARLWQSGFSADCDQGRYDSTVRVRAQVRAALAFPGGDDDIDEAWCAAFLPNLAVIDVLDRCRGDLALALFTNNGPLEEEALTRRYPDIFARFDHRFFSHRLRRRKPDPAAFSAVARDLGVSGEQIVFVDDSPANVAAARELGWHAVQYRDVAGLRHDLGEAAERLRR